MTMQENSLIEAFKAKRELEAAVRSESIRKDISSPYSHAPMIYVIWNGTHIKIGVSTRVTKRIESLQTASPLKLKLLALKYGHEGDEQNHHKALNRFRAEGEWFRITDEVCDEIDRIAIDGIGDGAFEVRSFKSTKEAATELDRPLNNNSRAVVSYVNDKLINAQRYTGISLNKYLASNGIYLQAHRGDRSMPKLLVVPSEVSRNLKIASLDVFNGLRQISDTKISDMEILTVTEISSIHRMIDATGIMQVKRGILVSVTKLIDKLIELNILTDHSKVLGDLWPVELKEQNDG